MYIYIYYIYISGCIYIYIFYTNIYIHTCIYLSNTYLRDAEVRVRVAVVPREARVLLIVGHYGFEVRIAMDGGAEESARGARIDIQTYVHIDSIQTKSVVLRTATKHTLTTSKHPTTKSLALLRTDGPTLISRKEPGVRSVKDSKMSITCC